jgi:preprotein translocase subunit YajC
MRHVRRARFITRAADVRPSQARRTPMFSSPAYAQAAGAPASSSFMTSFGPLIPMIAIIGIMWFLIIRPQQQKVKQHQSMVDAVKKGDTVVTGGGTIGKVTKVDGEEIEVEVAPNTRIRVVKSTLTTVRGATVANDRA